MRRQPLVCTLSLALALAAVASGAATVDLGRGTTSGAVPLASIGPLAFGDDGVLFVGDSIGAAIFALDTGDTEGTPSTHLEVRDIERKIAALLGTTTGDIRIHDLATNPLSGKLYLSVSRGQGTETEPAIVTVAGDGTLALFDLTNVRHSRAALDNAPGEEAQDRRGRPLRRESLTDLEYGDGTLLVTGLSNEEFSSKLRKVTFPFAGVGGGTSVEIFHGAHGRWETNAPVRTMALYDVAGVRHVLAAYTCTPLVQFSLAELADGHKVTGKTIAELGNRNRPLDMVVYEKDGKDYVLMANSSRGVMKIDLARIGEVDAITERIADKAGLPYETVAELEGIEQLAPYGDGHAVLLARTDAGSNLFAIPLP